MIEKDQQFTEPQILPHHKTNLDTLAFEASSIELDDCQDKIEELNKELDQRFTEIAVITRLLLEKDQYSDQLNELIELKNIQNAELSSKIEFLENSTRALNAALNEKSQQIGALHALRDTLITTFELKSHAYDDLLSQMEIKAANIRSVSVNLSQAEAHLASRDAEITHLQSKLSEIYGSTSWRVTAPLRYVKKLLGFIAQ